LGSATPRHTKAQIEPSEALKKLSAGTRNLTLLLISRRTILQA